MIFQALQLMDSRHAQGYIVAFLCKYHVGTELIMSCAALASTHKIRVKLEGHGHLHVIENG